METYSHTRLQAFEKCPLSYKLEYIDKIKMRREGIEAFMGKCVHAAMEKLYADLQYCKIPSEDELVGFYQAAWDEGWHDEIQIVREGRTPDNYRDTGAGCLRDYYRAHHPFEDGRTIWLEGRILVPLVEDDCRLQGYVDRLVQVGDGSYEIHDYKTSGSLPSQDDVDRDRQLALYQLGVQNAFPDAEDVTLVWHYMLFGKRLESRRTPEELESLRARTMATIEAIRREEEFAPRESPLCGWCDYQPLCPHRKHLCAVRELDPEVFAAEDGVRLADRYKELHDQKAVIEEEMDALRARIEAYCEQQGVDRVCGTLAALALTTRSGHSFPKAGSEERAMLEGLVRQLGHWDEVSGLNTFTLNKVLAERRWDEYELTQLEQFAERRSTTTISMKKLPT